MKIIDICGKKYLNLNKKQFQKLHDMLLDNPQSQKDGSFVFNLCCLIEEEELD